jgi:hypothetical protein
MPELKHILPGIAGIALSRCARMPDRGLCDTFVNMLSKSPVADASPAKSGKIILSPASPAAAGAQRTVLQLST